MIFILLLLGSNHFISRMSVCASVTLHTAGYMVVTSTHQVHSRKDWPIARGQGNATAIVNQSLAAGIEPLQGRWFCFCRALTWRTIADASGTVGLCVVTLLASQAPVLAGRFLMLCRSLQEKQPCCYRKDWIGLHRG